MNNKERLIIAHFLNNLEDTRWRDDNINGLFKKLNDSKLSELYLSFEEYDKDCEKMLENIRERSIDLWLIDFPQFAYDREGWALFKSYKTKKYWKIAKQELTNEFKMNDDMYLLDTIEDIN